ncbi:MAG TPA: hypothetical protein DCZ03_14850 [Gammaproteobacteria bacterium]|nr:hypothetical protein [Gammaproteobacteria bacterium]
MKILFVDDEQKVLDGIKRTLRNKRHDWEMTFESDPNMALKNISQQDYDFIVTDLRMPGLTGSQLLKKVTEISPHSTRIVLSGDAELDRVVQTVGTAHQFIAKPCELNAIQFAIERTARIKNLLKNENLARLVGGVNELPSLPTVYNELVSALSSDKTSVEEIGDIISQDVGLSTKVLKTVNSAFFGLSEKVSNPTDATVYLGLDVIRGIVLANSTLTQLKPNTEAGWHEQFVEENLFISQMTKAVAKQLEGKSTVLVEEAFQAGLLHDIGRLLIATKLPEEFKQIEQLVEQQSLSLIEAEQKILQVDHALLGAYLLTLWGFNDSVIEAVLYHHQPEQSLIDKISPLSILILTLFAYEKALDQDSILDSDPENVLLNSHHWNHHIEDVLELINKRVEKRQQNG